MIHRFLAIALLAIGATVSHAQPSLPSSFQAKPFTARKQRTSSCAGEERALSCAHSRYAETATPGSSAADLMKDHTVVVPGPSWNWKVIEA